MCLAVSLVVVGCILSILGLIWIVSTKNSLLSELRDGTKSVGTVVKVRSGRFNSYLVDFTVEGQSQSRWLVPFEGDPDLRVGEEIIVVSDDSTPPSVVTSQMLTSKIGSTYGSEISMYGGLVAIFIGLVVAYRAWRQKRLNNSAGDRTYELPIVAGGFDISEVDTACDQAIALFAGSDLSARRDLSEWLGSHSFTTRARGYDKAAVAQLMADFVRKLSDSS